MDSIFKILNTVYYMPTKNKDKINITNGSYDLRTAFKMADDSNCDTIVMYDMKNYLGDLQECQIGTLEKFQNYWQMYPEARLCQY